MTRTLLPIETLTRESFAPYGDVIEVNKSNRIIPINYGLTERHHELAAIDIEQGYPVTSIFYTQAITLPFQIRVMERHPLGSQAFLPLDDNSYLVVVAEAGEFDHKRLKAFQASAQQCVNYHKGTGHHYCLALNTLSQFAVVDRAGNGKNCDESNIPEEHTLLLDHQTQPLEI